MEHIMTRMLPMLPMAWTMFELVLASAAAWLLCETNALGDAAMLLVP
jgi:hypothetical protein